METSKSNICLILKKWKQIQNSVFVITGANIQGLYSICIIHITNITFIAKKSLVPPPYGIRACACEIFISRAAAYISSGIIWY